MHEQRKNTRNSTELHDSDMQPMTIDGKQHTIRLFTIRRSFRACIHIPDCTTWPATTIFDVFTTMLRGDDVQTSCVSVLACAQVPCINAANVAAGLHELQ